MNAKPISHTWTCTSCALVSEIFRQADFKTICLDLLAGNTGLVICPGCQHTDRIRFRNSELELVIAAS